MLKPALLNAVKAGASEILRFFNNDFTVSNKEGINNLVTEADRTSERLISHQIGFLGHIFKRRGGGAYPGFQYK
jgi:myo-inositol-1(or 4)-monophosphatase